MHTSFITHKNYDWVYDQVIFTVSESRLTTKVNFTIMTPSIHIAIQDKIFSTFKK